MKIKTTTKGIIEMKEITANNTAYVSHQDLKNLVRQESVMFDFPHISADNYASAMCVVSNMQGLRCYGTGQAPVLMHAADLAFDNAVIDLYNICARSAVELDIAAAADQIKTAKAAKQKAAEETAAKKAAEEAAAKEVAAKESAKKKAAEAAAAKKATEEAARKKATEEVAAAKKTAEEAAAKKAAEEAAAKKKATEEAAAKKAAEEAAKKKAAEAAAAKKAAEEAAAKKAAEEVVAKDAATKKDDAASAKEPAEPKTGYWYVNEADWLGCHSLTPDDPDDAVVDYGPFKKTGEVSDLRPGPKYLSQVLKYRSDFIEKLIGIQPPAFMVRVPQILTYCERQGIGLRATSDKARDILAQYGVKEL